MSPQWTPPRRSYHLRVFALSLGFVVVGLAGFLLGVRMEAVEPATGIVVARDLAEVRSLLAGLIEPGWYEGEVAEADGRVVRVRLDAQGTGVAELGDQEAGEIRFVTQHRLQGKLSIPPDTLRYHRLQAGDELWPGQPLAGIRTDAERLRLEQIENRFRDWQSSGNHGPEREQARAEAELLRQRLAQATLHVPETGKLWQAVQVRVAPLQAVQPGDLIASIVPVDPATHEPLDLVVRLEVDEKHAGGLAPGQTVRLFSALHAHRLHGHAEARIERIEPWAEATPEGGRRFVVHAPVTAAPFPLSLGSSVKAEIIVGHKVVYRIILEH
jgi:hypothetical protein